MNKLMVGIGLCIVSGLAWAGEQVDRTLDAKSDGYVVISHVNGYAKITGWDKEQVRVVGELSDRTSKFIFERKGNEVEIKVKVKDSNGWGNWNSDDGDDLEIFVPFNSVLDYTSTNANVEVSEIRGGTDIETVNGGIDASNLSGRINIESVNGDIVGSGLKGKISFETVNGDIRDRGSDSMDVSYESVNGDIEAKTNSPEVQVETVNGDVELNLQKVEQLAINTVNGTVEVALDLAKNADVRATSVGGTVELSFARGVSARFDLKGHAGGRIINNLTADKEQRAKYGPTRWLEFSTRGGNGRVTVSTVSGRIKLQYQ